MNKFLFVHIILFYFGSLITVFGIPATETASDSLVTDNSPIEKRHFEELTDKYSGNDYIYERTVEQSGWWTRFKQWLSDLFQKLFNLSGDGQASSFTEVALKIFYVVVFLLVVYFIFRAIINKEGTWVFGKSSEKNIVPVTDIENNIHVADFKSLIEIAESEKNYRLAVRYYYLWLLRSLTNAQLIDYDVEKTDSDYLYELQSKDNRDQFSYTSYLYNYIWYGEFDVNTQQFDKAKHAFTTFINNVKA
ncbi:hypothetical protein [Meridianimaribacter sp. CL38]|uniref:hypothetical protein n=1 Tax=Meridianimaribacter sp. CL38 TaxID=2213021 RepID=UPI00103DD5D0|nr:hypothetical protein [Meridianimaribacter sp. CL38]